MTLLLESLLVMLAFYSLGLIVGWGLWRRGSRR